MVIKDGAKMSKSLGNVVSPDEMVARYGADATRTYTLFAAPPDRDLDWQDAGVKGVQDFLARVYRFVATYAVPQDPQWRAAVPEGLTAEARRMRRVVHQTVKRITHEFGGRWHFNTCVSSLMSLLNELNDLRQQIESGAIPLPVLAEAQRTLVMLLQPFAPYLAHELWEMMGERGDLLRTPWPEYDPALAKEEEIELAVQVNGKLRGRIVVPADTPEPEIQQRALQDEKVSATVAGKNVVKVIVVAGKLVNIVVR
jgi:leucyl-tRNA synthetase